MSVELAAIADRLGSDKGTSTYCGHGYTRIYEAILAPARLSPLRIAEIGLVHPRTQQASPAIASCPSLEMWAEYLPAARVHGFDLVDFTALSTGRIHVAQGDQGNRQDLERFAAAHGPFDLVIDDGSHASHHQQITLGVLFRHLAPGGLYIIEDLHYQPAGLEVEGISPTREFLRGLRHGQHGARIAMTQAEVGALVNDLAAIRFFDSASMQWPQSQLEDALAVLVRRGTHPYLPAVW